MYCPKNMFNRVLVLLFFLLSVAGCMPPDLNFFERGHEERVLFLKDNELIDELSLDSDSLMIAVKGLHSSKLQNNKITHEFYLRLSFVDMPNVRNLEIEPQNIQIYLGNSALPFQGFDTLRYESNKKNTILIIQSYYGDFSNKGIQAVSKKRYDNPFMRVDLDKSIKYKGEYLNFDTIFMYQQDINY